MQHTFQFRDKTIEVQTDFINDESHWFVRFTDQDGLLNEYRVIGYPNIEGKAIKVMYSFALKRPNEEILKSYQDFYYETRIAYFYNTFLPANICYGEWAAIQCINGLIARLPVFEGSKESPDTGYRVFNADGSFYQPVAFDIVNLQHETMQDDGSGNIIGNQNGSFEISVINGAGGYEYSLDNVTYENAAVFYNLTAGEYTAFVRDQAGTVRFQTVKIEQIASDQL